MDVKLPGNIKLSEALFVIPNHVLKVQSWNVIFDSSKKATLDFEP